MQTCLSIPCSHLRYVLNVHALAYLFAGNFPLFIITSQGHHELRVDLEDWEGNTRFAKYRIFNIGHPTELYNLTALGYTGDAGNHIIKCVLSDVICWCAGLSSRTSCLFSGLSSSL